MNYLTAILAATGGVDGITISVAAITALGVGVAAVVKAHRAGMEAGKKTRTKVEPNPLPVTLVETLATKGEMRDLEGRLVGEIRKLETQVNGERTVARTANSHIHQRLDGMAEKKDLDRIHERIDAQTVATAGAVAALTEVKSNVNQLLALALNRKPTPRS